MIQESEIRAQLVKYLTDEMSLDDFEDWLAQHSWDMHKDSSLSAQRLASAIELRLGEYGNGHLSEEDLRKQLRSFVVRYVVTVSFAASDNFEVEYGSISEPIPLSLVGKSSAAEFV